MKSFNNFRHISVFNYKYCIALLPRLRNCLIFLFQILLVQSAISSQIKFQSIPDIEKAVRDFKFKQNILSTKIKIDIVHLDSRLRLPACSSKLETFSTSTNANQSTVGVRCNDLKSWTIFVPTKVTRFIRVVVSRRPLPRGYVIKQDDVQIIEREIPEGTNSYLDNIDKVLNRTLKKSLLAGAVIDEGNIELPKIVHRGDQVTIVIEKELLSIKMQGSALEDGSLTEKIRVKNSNSRKIIEAVVIAPGTVKVRF